MKRKLSFLMLFMAFCSFAIGQTTPDWGENHASEYLQTMAYALVVHIDDAYQETDQLEVAPYYGDKRVGEPVKLLKAPDAFGGKYVADGIISAVTGAQIKFKMYNYATEEFFGFSDNSIEFDEEETGNILNPSILKYTSVAEVNNVKYGNFQNAVNAAADGQTVKLNKDVVGDVLITQTANVSITIDGNNKSFTGIMKVFGNGNQNGEETLTIKNINFIAKEGADACIVSPERNTIVYNSFSYSHNVTVIDCTFTDPDGTVNCAAIRHEDGGDKNWTVKNCTVANTMHSLLQVNNVINKLVVDGCTVNSKNGVNLNSCTNVEFTNNVFNVQGYALRSGVTSGGNLGETKTYVLNNNKLQSACNDGDAVIMFRASSVDAKFTMDKNVIKGDRHISGNTADTKFNADANYWDGENTPRSTTPIVVTTYYLDEALTQLARNAMGNTIIGYTSAQGIWSETWGNAVESYVVKALDADGNVMGTTSLNNIGGIIDGDVTVTWNLKLDAASNTDNYWAMSWTTAPTIDNMPKKVQLWIDGVNVSEGPVVLNGPDGQNPIFAAKTDAYGKIISYIACDGFNLNNANDVLQHSIADGDNIAILVAGTYKVPTGKDVTITGAVDGVVFDNIGACGMAGADVTFNNVTFDYYPNVNYTGLQHSGNLVYNNCTINGQVFLYGEKETFNNCKFNQNSSDAYNVWTYGAKEVVFNECTFNSAGKSVLIYAEGESIFNDVTVTGCTFNATASVEGKAAIEMDSSLTSGIELTITNTTAEGFGTGNISGNSLWNNKKGNEGNNNDITVIVDGVTVLAPEYEAQIGEVKYQHLTDAIAAAQAGDVVKVFAGTYPLPSMKAGITIEGAVDENGEVKVLFEGTLTGTLEDLTLKNIHIRGGNAQRWAYAKGDLKFVNVIFEATSVYALHFDGITEGTNLLYEDCTIIGWAAMGGTPESCKFIRCTIKDNGTYGVIRTYFDTTIKDCTFDVNGANPNDNFQDGIHAVYGAYVIVNGCTNVNGTMEEIVNIHAMSVVSIDGVEIKHLAKIGDNYYFTLAEAFTAAQDGETIKVLHNIALTEGVTVAAGKTVVLDLNGKTISRNTEAQSSTAAITNNGNLTIKDEVGGGKVTAFAANPDTQAIPYYASNTITNCGVLTVLSGTIENSTGDEARAAYPIDNNSTLRDVALYIKGGTITGRGAIRLYANSNTNKNEVNVTAGTVTGTSYAIWVQNPGSGDPKASLNIEGGELSKILMDPNANFEGSITGGTITEVAIWEPDATNPGRNPSGFIKGGTFGMDVTEFCAFNYVCTPNGNGTYGVQYKPQQNNAFVIETLHELEAFRDAVNAGNDFEGDTVVLSGGVDLNPTRAINIWEPIGTQANPFKGTFDGGNNTISNLVVEGENYLGLFGKTDGATIKNVKINNVTINGVSYLGAIVGMGYTGTIDNCHVTGYVEIAGNYMVGGINGQGYATVNNSSVVANDNSFVKAIHDNNNNEGDNVGGIVGHCGETNTLTANTVKNITISGTRKVGGIVGIANQGTKVENCVVEDVTIETSATEAYANDNITTMSIGALIGQYQNNGSAGTVKDCMVKNVEFNNVNNVNVSVGPITGGSRGGTNGMLAPTGVTASGNNIFMSTITGSNNLYLMNAVAKIGTIEYYTLFDAVAAVQDGETKTITMLRNTAEEFAIDNTTANITLNMAGFTLTGAITPSKANLTIENGTINNENASYSAIEINAGTLVLNDVTVTSKRHGVRIDGAVTATINGGEYRLSATSGTRHAVNVSGGADVTIKAGTFVGPAGTSMDSGSAVCVQSGAKVTIEGGDFSGGKNATLGVSGTMIVKGGTFDQDPSAYLADAYTVNIENEMYVVRYTPIMVTYPVGNPVYPEGKVEYYSDMLEAVPYTTNCPRLEGATITLLADVSGAGMRFMENDMVFDLNGHTYTITAGTGSQGTNTSGFQIRPEVTTNVLFKDGTIKVAEGAPVVWMFNCYATDFIVENVTVDCSNMAYSYGGSCYVVVSREGDNVQLTGETKIVNFNSDVAGNAINVGDTMTIGEDVDLGGGTIELDGGAQLTAPANLNVVTVDDYMVVYENGVYKSVKVVAQVGNVKYESVAAAMTAAKEDGVRDLEITIIGENTQDTDDSFNLSYSTAFDNVTIKQDNDNKPFYIKSIYTGDRTSTDGKFVFDGVNMIITGQIWFECDVVLTNNSSVKRSNDVKNFIYYGEVTVEPGSKYISQIDDVMAGSFTVDGGKTDGTYNEAEDFKTVFFDVRYGQTFTAKNGANILISSGEGGKLSLMGNANIDASKVYVYNEIALGDNGKFALDIESSVTTNNVTGKGVISVDALNINEGVVYNVITANMSSFAGIIEINNDDAEYEITSTGLVVKMKPFVAEVDGTQFTSLQAAIDAADGKTVVVLDNITLTETVTVAAGTTVTLDLNGKTVSQTKEQTTGYQMILNDGNLTIVDNTNEKLGKISYTDSGNGGEYVSNTITNRGTITVKSGTIENLSSQTVAQNGYPYAIDSSIWGDASEVNTIVEGGKVHGATYSAIRLRADSNSEPVNVTVSGGEIVGTIEVQVPSSTVAGKGALVISGGKLSNSGTSNVLFFFGSGASAENIEVSVTGGEFTGNITISSSYPIGDNFNKNFITGGTFSTDVNDYCHEYYDAIQGADNLWRVERVLFAQTTALQGGWNWFSSYVDLSTPDGLEKLQTALVGNGVQIKTQGNQFSFYQNNQWNSSAGFTSLYNEKMYMIQTTNDVNVELIGSVIDYANTVIVLNKGWNWISYPLDVNTEVNEALKNMSPSEGDIIKGYADNTTSVYYTSDNPATPSAWWPSITLNPGQGYMYNSKTNTSFRYAAGNGTSAKVDSRDNNYWVAAKSQYANNMTIIAMLSIDNEIVKGDYEIAAFANGECRGSARPIYNEYLDAYILLLTVYGDDVEELTFKYYDIDTDTEYELSNVMNYSNDAIVGTLSDPYIFSMNILGIGENSIDNINIYPNPTTTDREINLQAICDKVEVFNALGVKVAEYHNVDTLDAFETAGIYVIRITNDNAVKHCRLVVK